MKGLLSLTDWIEGVLVAKKDFNLPKHGDIDTKNLYVSLHWDFSIVTRKPRILTYLSIIGHQGLPVSELPWLHQDPVLVAVLLLHPHPRGMSLRATKTKLYGRIISDELYSGS